LQKPILLADFETDIERFVQFNVSQADSSESVYFSGTFQSARFSPSKFPTLFLKNDACEMHIRNIEEVYKTRNPDHSFTYAIRSVTFGQTGERRFHICSLTCR